MLECHICGDVVKDLWTCQCCFEEVCEKCFDSCNKCEEIVCTNCLDKKGICAECNEDEEE